MMEGTIKGIILDKDGTLYDYVSVWAPVIKTTVRTILISLNIKDSGKAAEQLYEIIGIDNEYHIYKDGIVFNHHKVFRAFCRLFGFCMRHCVNPFSFYAIMQKALLRPDDMIRDQLENMDFSPIRKLMEKLGENGIRIGVVTNDTTASARSCFRMMGITDDIEFLRSKESNCRKKPNGEAVRQFCATFGLKPSEVCVVGDATSDMDFAHNGGCGYAVGLLTGSRDREGLEKHGADVIYDDITALIHDKKLFPDG